MEGNERLLKSILEELRLMRKEQTGLIRLWMSQDKHYHKRTLKGLNQ